MSGKPTELIEWLRAVLVEVKRVALATAEGGYELEWRIEDDRLAPLSLGVMSTCAPGYIDPPHAEHIVLHDPAQALRQVEATRRLLQQFELRGNSVRATVVPSTGGVWDDLLRMLALPYAEWPGYRKEWGW